MIRIEMQDGDLLSFPQTQLEERMCELISPPIKFLIGESVVLKYNGGPIWKFISRKGQDLTDIHLKDCSNEK
jgi:hypothetical protein